MNKWQILAIFFIVATVGVGYAIADSYIKITQIGGQTTNPILVEDSGGIDKFWISTTGEIFTVDDMNFQSGTGFTGSFEHAISADKIWTMPDATGTVVLNDNTATLTGKSMSGASNTFTSLGTSTLDDDAVTYAKMQNVASDDRFLGRISGAGGNIEELTGTQATTLLNPFTDLLQGVVTASGGGTTNFLRADGTWSAPTATVDIISEGNSNVEVIDAGTGTVEVDIDGSNQYTFTGTELDVQANNVIDVTDFYQTGDIAEAGNFRLSNAQQLCSEASPAGTDACITLLDATENFIFGSGFNNIDFGSNPLTSAVLGGTLDASGNTIDNVAIHISNDADPADAGAVRFGNAETIAWEANPASTDLTITADASENFVWDTAWVNLDFNSNPVLDFIAGALLDLNGNDLDNVDQYFSDDADPADTANAINLGNAESLAWEASPAGTDLTITTDSSENFVFDSNFVNIDTNGNPLTEVATVSNSGSYTSFSNSINITSGQINMTGSSTFFDINTNKIKGSMTCTNGQILEYASATDLWTCGTDDGGGSPSDIISEGNSNVEVIDAGTGTVEVDVDGANQITVDASVVDFQSNELRNYVKNVETITGTDTLTTDNDIIILDPSTTAFTITLPAVSGTAGQTYDIFYKATTGTVVTIDGNGAETINDVANIKMEHYLSKVKLTSDGSEWFAEYDSAGFGRENHYILFDDFSGGAITEVAGEAGDANWSVLIDGTTGDDLTFVDGVLDKVGIITIGAGTTSGNDWALLLGATATLTFMDADQPNWSMTTLVSVPTITTVIVRIGLAETVTGASWESADNAFFKFNPAVSANWQCVTFETSPATTTTTGIVVNAGQYYKLKILKDGSTIRFLIDDVNVCNHATDAPTALVSPALQVETATTALRSINIDYFRLSMILAR